MNSRLTCDQIDLESYLIGDLYEEGCDAVEAHALTCEGCRSKIEAALAPVGDAVRKSHPLEPTPRSVLVRIEARHRKTGGAARGLRLAMASSVAVLAAGLAYRQCSMIVLTEVEGQVLAEGKMAKSGDAFFRSVQLTSIGPARIRFGSEEVLLPGVWGQFQIDQIWGQATASRFITPAYPSHSGSQSRAMYRVGTSPIETLGTRFGILSPLGRSPALAVYSHRIHISEAGNPRTVSEGRAWGQDSLAQDDPTRLHAQDLLRVPGLGDRPASLLNDEPPPRETAQRIQREASRLANQGQSAGTYVAIARALADAQEHAAAGWAVWRALELDPALTSVSDEDLLVWMADQAAFGESRVQFELRSILVRRRAPFDMDSWSDLLHGKNPQARRAAAWRLYRSAGLQTRISCAWLAFDQVRADASGRSKLDAIAEDMGVLASGNRRLTNRSRARAFEVRAECLYYHPGREGASLEPLGAALRLWTTKERTIHYLTRLAETGNLDRLPEARERLRSAFFAEPTFRNAERVLVFLQTAARAQDREGIYAFARWIGETFRTLVPAQMSAAGVLQELSPLEALPFVDRAMAIAGNDAELLMPHHALLAARIQWKSSSDRSDKRQQDLVAHFRLSGPEAAEFHLATGRFRQAHEAIESEPESAAKDLFRARCLVGLELTPEAAELLRSLIDQRRDGEEPMLMAEAEIRLAELLRRDQPKEAAALASRLLGPATLGLDQGWRKNRRYDLMFRARAFAVLGRYEEAIHAQTEFLSACAVMVDRREQEARMKEWRRLAQSSRGLR